MKNSNIPDKPRKDLQTRLRQEILPDPGGLGGEKCAKAHCGTGINKNSNVPDKPRKDLQMRLRQEILPDPGGLGGESALKRTAELNKEVWHMELWFSELHSPDVKMSIRVDKQLYSGESDLQRIDVFESKEFGRILALDGDVKLTEKDEFIYHEMLVHVPMAVHPDVRKVLVIGSGDGGAVRELAKYPEIEQIDLVESDRQVVQVSREFLPKLSCALDDERLYIVYEDGLRFVRGKEDEYDLIIVASTDPFGPGEGLFTKEFYDNCYSALKKEGIMVNQHESPFYEADATACMRAHRRIVESFPVSRVYQAHIPTFPSGQWLFGFASKQHHPVHDLNVEKWMERGIETRYYTPRLHAGAFCLPAYVEKLLRKVEIRG